ncbi:MAG: hypothetical protein DRP78_01245 [Candidatus Omnitrophota bacterium]|nr:MAG: hypothetical protein DRP78_01245 [Candidatus Omnitrophota bacterium]
MKEQSTNSYVTLRDYLSILFHRKQYFLLPMCIVFFTASIGSFFLPKYYSSSAIVLVQEEKMINPLSAPKADYYRDSSVTLAEQLRTFTEKILNYPQLLRVIKRVGMDKNVANQLELEKLILLIRKRTEVLVRSPEVFEVIYVDKDPEMAQNVVNNLIQSFIEYTKDRKSNLALIGVNFAESQAEIYKEKLNETEKALTEFKNKFFLKTPGKSTEINVSLLINTQTSLSETQLLLAMQDEKIKKLEDQLSGREPVMISGKLLDVSPIIRTLNGQLRTAQVELYNLLHNDPASERVLEYELRVDDLRRRLEEETEKIISQQSMQTDPVLYTELKQTYNDLKEEKAMLVKKESGLQKLVNEYENRIQSLPEQDMIYSQLVRDNHVTNNIYEMLLLKIEENRLDAVEVQQKGTIYEIIEQGRLPLKPSKPKKLLISIIAIVLGIIIGAGCVFVVEITDHSFRSVEDAKRFLDVPVVGSTMRILSLEELSLIRKKRFQTGFLIAIAVLILFAIGVSSSYFYETKIVKQIIRDSQ